MKKRWRRVRSGELGFQFLASDCVRVQLVSDLTGWDAIHDGLHQLLSPDLDVLDFMFGRCQSGAVFDSKPVHFPCEFAAELFEQVLPQELVLKGPAHALFHFVAADGQQVVAPTLIACAEAGEPITASHDESRAADTALGQAGKQVRWTPRSSKMAC